MRFPNKVVLITGGNRGIGLAAARAFAAEGARLALVARDKKIGDTRARELNAIFLPADVCVAGDCERVVSDVIGIHGRLDVLVNNAGIIYRNRTVEQTTEAEWDSTMDTNVKGAFLMCKFALPALRASQGAIVNVSSYAGLVGFPGAAAYAASKAALINLTRTLALDHAKEHIRVNCVCPGTIETDMMHEAWRQYGDVEEGRRVWAAKHPLGRVAQPEELARAILFLASEEASFVTGVALAVDGGITAA